MFPNRAEDQLELAAIAGGVILGLIAGYVLAPDLIAWTGVGYSRLVAKVKAHKERKRAKRDRILRERAGRRDGYITGDSEVQP